MIQKKLKIEKSLDDTSRKMEDIESIKTIQHNLSNILGFSESCINRLKDADAKTMNRRWITLNDVIIATGRDRIKKETVLYRKSKGIIEKVSEEIHTDVCKQLLRTDKYYKALFDLLYNSNEYNEGDKNIALTNGDKMVRLLKDIINKMEAIKIELQKI